MLKIEHLNKTYKGGKQAVKDLSLHVQPGDLFGFIGPNGAGKTTTIKVVVGIHSFENGEIYIGGHSIRKEPIACKSITAYIPDNPDLYDALTGIQYLNFMADIFSVSATVRAQRLARYSADFELTDVLGAPISSYSHGMKQKLAIIAALIHEPKLLVLDEPFVGLDPAAMLMLKEIMHGICAQGGAIFFSTHVLEVAERLCNKVAIIKDGALIASGTMEEITAGQSLEEVFMEVQRDA